MINANDIPNIRLTITSVVIPVTANSLPPLKPIENNKYKEIKFFDAAGTSKSLLTYFAKTPKMKKSNVGLVKLNDKSSKLIMEIFPFPFVMGG
jgi:hypothetical protein